MSVLDLLSCIDWPTSYWSTSNRNVGRFKYEKGEILTKKRSQLCLQACLPPSLLFWEGDKITCSSSENTVVAYSIKLKLLLLAESKDKSYILLYLHSASWNLTVLHTRSQKMGKRLYRMPRGTCISITLAFFQLISPYQWKSLRELA